MTDQMNENEKMITELGLSNRVLRLLQRNRILTIKDLTSKTEKELRRISQFGNKCFREVRDALEKKKLKLKAEDLSDVIYAYARRPFNSTTCGKCPNKAIYILRYCTPFVALCKDHCPKLSNGKPGYTKLTIIDKAPLEYHDDYTVYEHVVNAKPPKDRCWRCDKLVVDVKDFILQGVKNSSEDFSHSRVNTAVPIIEVEYWICRKGCDAE